MVENFKSVINVINELLFFMYKFEKWLRCNMVNKYILEKECDFCVYKYVVYNNECSRNEKN